MYKKLLLTSVLAITNAFAGVTPPERATNLALNNFLQQAVTNIKSSHELKGQKVQYVTHNIQNFIRGKYAPGRFSDYGGRLGIHFEFKSENNPEVRRGYAECESYFSLRVQPYRMREDQGEVLESYAKTEQLVSTLKAEEINCKITL